MANPGNIPPVPPGLDSVIGSILNRWLISLYARVVSSLKSFVFNTANGFSGTVSDDNNGDFGLTVSVTVSGVLKGAAGALVQAVAGTDYIQNVSGTSPVVITPGAIPNISMTQSSSTVNGWLSSTDWTTFNSKVTSVSATSPVQSSGGTTPIISMLQASATRNGWLSSTDWSAFSNKVTSVSGTAPISSTGGLTPVISMPQASGSSNGWLSSSDWATFNSKLNGNQNITLSGDATGNGTTAIPVTLAVTGVTAGSYGSTSSVGKFTVDAKGRITSASSVTISIPWSSVTSTPTTLAGYGITAVSSVPVSATTLSASGNEALTYGSAGGQSIPNNTATTLTNWTKIVDRLNVNFVASTGVYTAPATGYYAISAQVVFASITPSAVGNQFNLYLLVNGTVNITSVKFAETVLANFQAISMPMRLFLLNAGDVVTLQVFQNSGSTATLMTTTNENWVSIVQIP